MYRKALSGIVALCTTAVFVAGCPAGTASDGEIIGTLTVSASGALKNAGGLMLRAREKPEYAGHKLVLRKIDKHKRVEQLINPAGEVVRERRGESRETHSQTQEQQSGDDCTVFTDAEGNEVANSCAVPGDRGDLRCERLDALTDDGESLICAICYDSQGNVITRECHRPDPSEPPCMDGDANCGPAQCRSDADCRDGFVCALPECSDPDLCGSGSCVPVDPPCLGGPDGQGCEPPPPCEGSMDSDCMPPPVEECHVEGQGDQTCRVCTTPDGQTFEECYVDPDPTVCEIIDTSDGLQCVYCYGSDGEIVERSCVPSPCLGGPADGCQPPEPPRCEEFVTPDGSYCEVCYDELGNVLQRGCEPQPPQPTECREYREADGRVCVLCEDQAGNIVRRDCQDPSCVDPAIAAPCAVDVECPQGSVCVGDACVADCQPRECRLFETANGYHCEICGDLNGDGVEDLGDANCYPPPVDPIRCEETVSSDGQSCVVCVDPQGNVVEENCGGTEPPRCVVQQDADASGSVGQACEICYDPAGNVVYNGCDATECWVEEVQDPDGAVVVCEVCATANGEISRSCHGTVCDPSNPNADCPPPPPACEQRENSDGSVCVICFDDAGNVIEERCDPGTPPPTRCEDYVDDAGQTCRTCYDEQGAIVEQSCDGNGGGVWCQDEVSSDGGTCTVCTDATGDVVSSSCQTWPQCWQEDYVEAGVHYICEMCQPSPMGPVSRECRPVCDSTSGQACVDSATVYVDPVQCGGNPWETDGASTAPGNDEVLAVRAWLDSLGVPAYNIRFERVYDATCMSCDCPRGDRLIIETTPEGAQILARYGFAGM